MLKQKVTIHNNREIELSAETFIERISQGNKKDFYILVKASNKDFYLVQLGTRNDMDRNSIKKACEMALTQAEIDLKSGSNKEYHFT